MPIEARHNWNQSIATGLFTIFCIALFFFGMAGASAVPFSYSSVSIDQAFTDIVATPRADFISDYLASPFRWAPAPMLLLTAVFIVYRNWPIRVVLAIGAVVLPLMFAPPDRALAIWLIMPIYAVLISIDVVTGVADGETWSEGWIAFTALGWWMIFWLAIAVWVVVPVVKLWFQRKRPRVYDEAG